MVRGHLLRIVTAATGERGHHNIMCAIFLYFEVFLIQMNIGRHLFFLLAPTAITSTVHNIVVNALYFCDVLDKNYQKSCLDVISI